MPKEAKKASRQSQRHAPVTATKTSEGFGGPSSAGGRYAVHADKYKARYNAFWKQAPNQNLQNDSVIQFQMTTRADQMIRFPANCFHLRFRAHHPNPDKKTGATDTNKQKAATHYTKPLETDPRVYLEPALGGASFFERVDVSINGHLIKAYEFGAFSHVYQTMNRTFCTYEHRMDKYGEEVSRVHTSKERELGDLTKLTATAAVPDTLKQLRACMNTMQSDDEIDSTYLVNRFSFDGVWPFDTQSNLLRASTREKKESGWLPPGITLNVTLYKRDPLTALLENARVPVASYYNDQNLTVLDADVVTIDLHDLQICYEVGTLHDQAKMDRMRKGTSYFVDVPTVTAHRMDAGLAATSNTVQIPPGTKLTGLTWMCSQQIYLNKASKKNMSGRFHYPLNTERVKVGFPGETPLYFEGGMENLGTLSAYKSATSTWYHRLLVSKGLYQHDVSLMFPRANTSKSFDQVLFCFLDEMKEHAELRVDCLYDSAMSQPGWYLLSTVLQQYRFHYTDKMPIKMERV